MEYECAWCKEAGLSKPEYTKSGAPVGETNGGKPLCEDCADEARRGD